MMDTINLNGLIQKVRATIDTHRLAEGSYRRWLWQDEKNSRNLGENEYGCADAANILYTIGYFVQEPEKRREWVKVLQNMQNPETGLFSEPTHHTIHTTAHCIAALELFDALPLYPLKAYEPYKTPEGLDKFLSGLDWEDHPWNNSHQGAGLYAALAIIREGGAEWTKNYFAWLREHADPVTGLGLKGRHGKAPLAHQLYGWFHYFFNHEHAHQPIPYPEKLIDSCIDMYKNKQLAPNFAREVGFMEIDWVFAMNRASRQTSYRNDEVRALLWEFAQDFIPWLDSLDEKTHDQFNDLHMLFGAMCAVAELQIALPGKLLSDVPLKNVLDRRPFI